MNSKLQEKIERLPLNSGVYIMYDSSHTIIYIGKALVLRNRVKQYFSSSPKLPKVEAMVSNIDDFEYMITLTEKDALSLEANLIRRHKPRYNILLKDDKSRPFIKINMREKFPNIEVVRKVVRDGARYFGPFFAGANIWDIVKLLRVGYNVRTCPTSMKSVKRECLYYHIKQCSAPCMGRISEADYRESINKSIAFLSGAEPKLEAQIKARMLEASESEDFERAIEYRNQLAVIDNMKEKKVAELGKIIDLDFFTYASTISTSVMSVLVVRGGKMMGVKNYPLEECEGSESDAIESFIAQYYMASSDVPEEIGIEKPFEKDGLEQYLYSLSGSKVDIIFPQKGMKFNLLQTCKRNSLDYVDKVLSKTEMEYNLSLGAVKELECVLGYSGLRRMECYDISNISGTDKVASCVVFCDGAKASDEYRRFTIKTVEGANDFASMAEVVRRRLLHGIDEAKLIASGAKKTAKWTLPDLIVVDGGKGQLSSALEVLTELGVNIPLISLAEREEEIFVVGRSEPIVLARSSYALRLLQRIRDEAHRFAITYHRNKRSKNYLSQLREIAGVGQTRQKQLLASFENFADIKQASVAELSAVKGINKDVAENIYNYFHSEK